MSSPAQATGDIALAVAAIAAELGRDAHTMPASVAGILRAFSAAHYNAGVRDTMVRLESHRARAANEPVPSPLDSTPIVGPHGRRSRKQQADTVPLSKRPTPLVPPPHGVVEERDKRKR